jgi:hypothetical protein
MKRPLALVTVALLALLAPGVASAGADPPNDLVTGHGDATDTLDISLAAGSGPLGEDPNGHFKFTAGGGGPTESVHVTCVAVLGDRAVVGGTDPSLTPPGVYLNVEDNGTEGDMAEGFVGGSGTQTDCLNVLAIPPFGPLVKGDITVHDALP